MTDLSKNIQALREKKAVVEMGGGEAAIEKQIAMGKLTARDRNNRTFHLQCMIHDLSDLTSMLQTQ